MGKKPAERGPLVVFLVADRLSLFEFSAAYEIFSEDPSGGSLDWYRPVISSHRTGSVSTDAPNVRVDVDHDLSALRLADTIVVPPSGYQHSLPDEVAAELRRAHAAGVRIASLCTGAFVLARAGLLNGKEATTHWTMTDDLARDYPDVVVSPAVLYVDNGDVLTSAGSAATLDLCLHLVRKDFGATVANDVARELVVPPHREGGQAQYVSQAVPSVIGGDPFSDALNHAIEHLSEELSVETLAARAAMSTRTFARRFHSVIGTTPHRWLTAQRLLFAQRLLEATDLSIDRIAFESGFGTATNLRQQFHRATGTVPSAYRKTFKTAS